MTSQVFVSYAHTDRDFALWLTGELQRRGVPVWVDKSGLAPGVSWGHEIANAIQACTHMVLILSPDAVTRAEVRNEMYFASDLRKRILPIVYRPCELPILIRPIQRVDFTTSNQSDALNQIVQLFTATQRLSTQSVAGPTYVYESSSSTPGSAQPVRSFTLSDSDRWIVGVCGGLAEYWGVSSTGIRVGFMLIGLVLALATSGIGPIVAYLVLWFMMRKKIR
jgi:phage shock protein PspC (stress-responsive transcriptional regulator)